MRPEPAGASLASIPQPSRNAKGCARSRRLSVKALLRCAIPVRGQRMITRMPRWSNGDCQVVEGDAEPVAAGGVSGDVVVAAAQVLHEGMTGGEKSR
jgi:hypothetical protein